MKSRSVALLLVVVTLACGGCASQSSHSSQSSSESAAESVVAASDPLKGIAAVRAEVVGVQRRLRAAQASLATLMRADDASMKSAFDAFQVDFDRAVESTVTLRTRADEMRAESREIIRRWADESLAGSEALESDVASRREEYAEQFDVLNARFVLARAALRPYMESLYDSRNYLSAELTRQRIDDIRPMADETAATVADVNARLDDVIAELDRIRAMSIDATPAIAPSTTPSDR